MVDQSSGARGGLAQERLELGEQLLDRVQIGAVGGQVEERGAGRGDRLADAIDPVRGQVVEHHDIARLERGRQELLHIGAEGDAGHWPVQHQRCDDAALPEPSDEGRGAPVAMRHGRNQTPTRRATALAPGHVGGGACLVEKDEPRRIHEVLPSPP